MDILGLLAAIKEFLKEKSRKNGVPMFASPIAQELSCSETTSKLQVSRVFFKLLCVWPKATHKKTHIFH